MSTPTGGYVGRCASYPPMVETHPVPFGYVQDWNRIDYSRDIGRSSMFAGHYYYLFGDTFCKDRNGDFVGLTNNTVAIMPDKTYPLDTQYLSIKPDGIVEPLLRLTNEEAALQNGDLRVCLWAFGGIVETTPEVGWMWYEKCTIYSNHNRNSCHGVGLARISRATNPQGQITAFRLEGLLFGADEPRIGSFSALMHEDFVYLWGDHKGSVILARVNKYLPTTRNAYKYWNGESYVEDWRHAVPILNNMQQGSFFYSPLFGAERPWCFVGCSNRGDSVVMMGAEARLEGPWTLTPLFLADGINQPLSFRYCMYAHPWAYDADNGELLVTWSENWPGGVVGAKVKLVTEDAYFWHRVPLNHYADQDEVHRLVAPWCEDGHNLDPSCHARIRLEGRHVPPGFALPPGTIPLCLRLESTDEETLRRAVEGVSVLLSLDQRLREDGEERASPGRRRSGRLSRALSRVFHRGSRGSGSGSGSRRSGGAEQFSI